MKLIGILTICCLFQALSGEAAVDTLKSGSPRTKGLRTVISDLLSGKKLLGRLASRRHPDKTLTSVVSNAVCALDLNSVTASLQDVFVGLESVNISSLSNSVNSAFTTITSTCHTLSSEVSGIIGSVDIALGGVNLALSSLIDTILTSMSATVRKLSHAIDNAIDKIINTLSVLISAVKGIIKTIAAVYSALQAILKTSLIVVAKTFNSVRTSLVESDLFVTPLLSIVLNTLSDAVTDVDVTKAIDIEKIVRELSNCSEGTQIEVECYSSTLDGSSNQVDIEVNAISTCPPYKGEWGDSLDGLESTISRSIDEILYACESGTKALPGWNDVITPAILNNLFAIRDVIDAALSASIGNSEKLEPAIVNIALGVQSILIALDSITTTAKKDHSELGSKALILIEHTCYTVISIVYDVFFGVSGAINGAITATSILAALTAILEIAIEGSPSELLEIRASIDYICDK